MRFKILIPIAAFLAGYGMTDIAFRQKQIPYPFELFGAAAGAGLAFWAYGFFDFLKEIFGRRS